MARRKSTAKATRQAVEMTQDTQPAAEPTAFDEGTGEQLGSSMSSRDVSEVTDAEHPRETGVGAEPAIAADEGHQEPVGATNHKPAYPAAAQAKISVGLSSYRGGPRMHLLRSQKLNQMQIRFDGEQPAEQFLAMLAQAGWKDRTEAEGVWTKQIDREARWQSVQQMEHEFRAVANALRRDRGLQPALEGMAMP